MKDRKKILLACCVCLLLACLSVLVVRVIPRRQKVEPPMEEEDLLAYLAEQLPGQPEEEATEDLFWDPNDPAAESQT